MPFTIYPFICLCSVLTFFIGKIINHRFKDLPTVTHSAWEPSNCPISHSSHALFIQLPHSSWLLKCLGLLVIQWNIVWLLVLLEFLLLLLLLLLLFFPHFWGLFALKTNRPISTELSQDIGSCLELIIFTLNHLSNERQSCYITLCNTTSNITI